MRAHFLQLAVLGDDARAADVEMIPDGAELALAVAAQQVLYGEVPVLAGGGAVMMIYFTSCMYGPSSTLFSSSRSLATSSSAVNRGKDSSIIG